MEFCSGQFRLLRREKDLSNRQPRFVRVLETGLQLTATCHRQEIESRVSDRIKNYLAGTQHTTMQRYTHLQSGCISETGYRIIANTRQRRHNAFKKPFCYNSETGYFQNLHILASETGNGTLTTTCHRSEKELCKSQTGCGTFQVVKTEAQRNLLFEETAGGITNSIKGRFTTKL